MGKAKKGAVAAASAPPPASSASSASLKPAKSPAADAQHDFRVTQQRRILEMVGTESLESMDDSKKHSPRTEKHIANLAGILEHYNFTRGDIAKLVKRCQYDESQIQVAVCNIMEEKANHEQDSWGEVKTKKQLKEENKVKEEEEKAEQERILRDLEKQRKDADKRAAREAKKAKDSGSRPIGAGAEDGGNGLPPDPAILFAGQKPGNKSGDDKWEGAASWKDGSSWNWQDGWDGDDKSKGGNQDSWWSGDWEGDKGDKGVKNTSGGDEWQSASGKKTKDKKAKSGERGKPKPDNADMWDMPDVAASNTEGGLDQWTLGDIKAHERQLEGHEAPSAEMHADEDDSLEPAGATRSAMKGLPPPPNAAPVISDGKQRLEALFQAGAVSSAASQQQIEQPQKGRGDKGRDDAKGRDRGDKGKGRERGERDDKPESPSKNGRPEAERIERLDRSDDPRRQPIQEHGDNVTVKKHSTMGCAVVTMKDTRVKEAVMNDGEVAMIMGIRVQLKRHTNKDTKEEVMTDIFVAWGRQVEKMTPLPEHEILKYFEKRHDEYTETWRAEAAAEAEEAMKAQRQLEEQQRQQVEQRQREEQMRAYEQQRSVMRDLGHAGGWAPGTQASTGLAQATPAATQQAQQAAYLQQRQQQQLLMQQQQQQQAQQAGSVAQQQWMAMACQQGWTPQAAAMAQQARGVPHQMHPGAMGQMAAPMQDPASQQRAATAYYYALMAEQQRGGNAAYAQQGGYGAQQGPAAYGYGGNPNARS